MDPKVIKLPEGVTVAAKHASKPGTMLTEITISPPTNAQLFDYGSPVKMGDSGLKPDMPVVQQYLADLADTPIEEIRKLHIDVGLQCTDAVLGFLGLLGDEQTDISRS